MISVRFDRKRPSFENRNPRSAKCGCAGVEDTPLEGTYEDAEAGRAGLRAGEKIVSR